MDDGFLRSSWGSRGPADKNGYAKVFDLWRDTGRSKLKREDMASWGPGHKKVGMVFLQLNDEEKPDGEPDGSYPKPIIGLRIPDGGPLFVSQGSDA
jgi:hypothetical protein